MAKRLHGLTDKAVKEQKAVNRIVRGGRQRRRPPNKRRRWPGGGGRSSVTGGFALIYSDVPACAVEKNPSTIALTYATPGLSLGDEVNLTGALLMEWDDVGDENENPPILPYARLKPQVSQTGVVFVDCKNPNPAIFHAYPSSPRLVKGEIVTQSTDQQTYKWFELPTMDQAATIIQGTADAAFNGGGGNVTITDIHQPGHQDELAVGDTVGVSDPGISFDVDAGGVVFAIREVGTSVFTIFQASCAA